MHSIKWPEKTTERGEGRKRQKWERNTGNGGGGEVEGGGGKVGIRPPYIRTDRDREGGFISEGMKCSIHHRLNCGPDL